MTTRGELLDDDERRALDLTVELWNLLASRVIGGHPSGNGDRAELATHIHNIQHMVMAQAAARAYPGLFRLLGDKPPFSEEKGRTE